MLNLKNKNNEEEKSPVNKPIHIPTIDNSV
jgi:hypothetical protein